MNREEIERMDELVNVSGDWSLIRNESEWNRWKAKNYCNYKTDPPEYPIFARQDFLPDESTEPLFLTAKDLKSMTDLISSQLGRDPLAP